MKDKLTTKEIQIFKFLHTFWDLTKGGEIRIIHHNHQPENIIVMDGKIQFDGKDEDLDEMKLLLSTIFPMKGGNEQMRGDLGG